MKVEIPEAWLVSMTGCHPSTPIKEALSTVPRSNVHLFNAYVGEYVINQILKDKYEKS